MFDFFKVVFEFKQKKTFLYKVQNLNIDLSTLFYEIINNIFMQSTNLFLKRRLFSLLDQKHRLLSCAQCANIYWFYATNQKNGNEYNETRFDQL